MTPHDFSALYVDVVNGVIDKLIEGLYDVVSSFDHCTKVEMTVKLGRLNWLKETLIDMLPEDFDKSDFSTINRHLNFVNYYYLKDKDFSMLKQNADDLLKQDIPALRKNLKNFLQYEPMRERKVLHRSTEGYVSQVVDDIRNNLRRLVREQPKSEKEIQDHLEDLLALKNHTFEREQVSIPYSTKSYIPDFTSDRLSIAIDVKLCNSPADEKNIIDEINADIPAYKQRYQYLLFVVYDIAVIRKLKEYISDIEKNNPDVIVIVIKH